MNIVNSFGALSGLQLNKKKTKAMWIGSSSKNKSMPLEFECPKEPIKFLGTFLSHDAGENIVMWSLTSGSNALETIITSLEITS